MKVYVIPHTHIDMEWYWTIDDTEKLMPNLFYDSALRMLREDDEMCFAQDQAEIFRLMLKNAKAEDKETLKKKIQEGKFEPVGGLFVQPEYQEPCGESMIRNFQIGQAWMEKNLGRCCRCAWNTDSFGQVNQLPQILKKCGFDSYVFMRDVKVEDDPDTFPSDFIYESPDGSQIVTHWIRPTYVVCESTQDGRLIKIANSHVDKNNGQEDLRRLFMDIEADKESRPDICMVFWGDDLYSLNVNSKEIKQYLIDAAKLRGIELAAEDIVISTPSEYFDELKKYELPVKKSDFGTPKYLQDLRATYVSRIKHKLLNRKAENALLSLEALNAVVGAGGLDLTETWKPVIFNQFHDLMGGSCLDENYLVAVGKYENAIMEADKNKKALLEAGNVEDGNNIIRFNPTQFKRDGLGPFEVKTENITPQQPMEVVYDLTTDAELAIKIENEFYSIEIDARTGDLLHVILKENNSELLGATGNVVVALGEDGPDMEGALHLNGVEKRDEGIIADHIVCTSGDDSKKISVTKKFLGFKLKKTITLNRGSQRIDFETDVLDYTGEDYILSTEFTGRDSMFENACEVPFAIEKNRNDFNCAQRWTAIYDNKESMAILNRGTCGYWVDRNRIRTALLRGYSDYWLYAEYGLARGFEIFNDGKNHTSLAAEKGDHHFEYALVAGKLSWGEITAEAEKYDRPIEIFKCEKCINAKAILSNAELPFIITSFSKSGENAFILRGYNASENKDNCRIEWAEIPNKVEEIDLIGNKLREIEIKGKETVLDLKPFEIVTLSISLQ